MEVKLSDFLTRAVDALGPRPRSSRPCPTVRSPHRDGSARGLSLCALALSVACLFLTWPTGAKSTEILPVDQIRAGMKGTGRTVFRGIEIEEFGVEIIGVIERARPAGNLILFRGEGEVLEHAGIIQGMSGSPVYIDGKLIGAVAFAYPGAMDPVGAITPIGEMLALWDDGLGPATPGPFPSLGDRVEAAPGVVKGNATDRDRASLSPSRDEARGGDSSRSGSGDPSTSGDSPGFGSGASSTTGDSSPSGTGDPSAPGDSPLSGTGDLSASGVDGSNPDGSQGSRSRLAAAEAASAGQYFDFGSAWGSFLHTDSATGVFSAQVPGRSLGTEVRGSAPQSMAERHEPGLLRPFRSRVDSGFGSAGNGLVPIGTPLCFSGWDPSLNEEITRVFSDLGMSALPVVAGGAGGTGRYEGVPRLEPGAAIGLRMIGGDADLVAIGTVTAVDGDRVVAFGHPMIQAGEVAFPMTGAWIHTVLANRNVSIKMGSSTNELGGIWNDRRPGIAGLHGEVPGQLPVRVEITDSSGGLEKFHYTVARHPFLTPFFLPWTVTNSYLAAGWVTGDASIHTDLTVYYDGGRTVRRVERIGGDSPATSLGGDITLPAVLLSINPWQSVRVDSLVVQVDYERGNPEATVADVRVSQTRAHPGDTVTVFAEVRPFRGDMAIEKFEVAIPSAWAGKSLRFYVGANAEFASWDQDRVPEKFVPHSLEQMVAMIERMPDDSKLTLRVYDGESGVLLQGVELAGLPPSLAGPTTGSSRPGGVQSIASSLLEERHLDTRWVLSGGSVVAVDVAAQ